MGFPEYQPDFGAQAINRLVHELELVALAAFPVSAFDREVPEFDMHEVALPGLGVGDDDGGGEIDLDEDGQNVQTGGEVRNTMQYLHERRPQHYTASSRPACSRYYYLPHRASSGPRESQRSIQ